MDVLCNLFMGLLVYYVIIFGFISVALSFVAQLTYSMPLNTIQVFPYTADATPNYNSTSIVNVSMHLIDCNGFRTKDRSFMSFGQLQYKLACRILNAFCSQF